MKKTLILSILTFGLLTSCATNGGGGPTLKEIELSGTYQTTFAVNEEFNYDGLVVIAHYSDHSIREARNYTVSTPDMTAIGNQDVTVTYKNKSKSYSIIIHQEGEISFPCDEVRSYLTSRGVSSSDYSIPSTIASLTGVLSTDIYDDDEYPCIQVTLDAISNYEAIYNQLSSFNYDMSGDIFVDPNDVIGIEIWNDEDDCYTFIDFYAYSDLLDPDPQEDEDDDLLEIDFPLQNSGYIASQTIQMGTTYTFDNFGFTFMKNDGVNAPKSERSNYIALYAPNPSGSGTGNTLAISSTIYTMKKIEFTLFSESSYLGPVSSDVGSVTDHVWTGNSKSVTFAANDYQYRFTNIKIYYVDESIHPEGGEMTVMEVYEEASKISYTPTQWYLSDVTVTVKIKAIDAIDSVTTGGGLDGNARGKTICVDNTGWIIISSGTQSKTDFYQRVKDYVKAGTTTYEVTGKIAFLNGVVEIKVDSYKYNSSLIIDYDLNNYLTTDTVNNSDSFMNHCKTIKTNKNGYGVGEIVRLNGLTYFNKYRKAGSYYFLDRDGKLLPIYSFLDKDRGSLMERNVYDIIGLETLYNGRPSLRILEVVHSELEPVEYDLNNAIEKEDTAYFYNINPSKEAYAEEYFSSVTTVYKMTVYVSRYTDDKYTFNVNYHYDYTLKEYTTGYSQADAANHNSLAMSNENLDYNQTFYDYALELAESEEGIEGYKVTIYFTLALLETVKGKEMWKANVFEEYVPQLGV